MSVQIEVDKADFVYVMFVPVDNCGEVAVFRKASFSLTYTEHVLLNRKMTVKLGNLLRLAMDRHSWSHLVYVQNTFVEYQDAQTDKIGINQADVLKNVIGWHNVVMGSYKPGYVIILEYDKGNEPKDDDDDDDDYDDDD